MVPDAVIHQLFLLNVALQIFDGLATYHGVRAWGEGNPALHGAMEVLGVGPALLLFKAKACGYLVLLRRVGPPAATVAGFALVATVYGTLSFYPWLLRLGSLAVP